MDTITQTPVSATRSPRSFRSLLLITGLAFAAGLAATIWGLSESPTARSWFLGEAPPMAAVVAPQAPLALAPTLAPAPEFAGRLADLESRMAKVESGSRAGSSTGRAEGLLIAFAARRALDRGLELGYVEGMLNQHFGQRQPRAVATVIAASRQPATLEQLRAGLETARPGLSGIAPNAGWWDRVKESVSSLFIVRRADTASPVPDIRIAQAQRFIESGRVDLALAEIARLPNRDKAADWMAMARRHVEAHRALDLLEAAAITQADASPPPPAPEPEPTGETL
jgi:hypothetical protein